MSATPTLRPSGARSTANSVIGVLLMNKKLNNVTRTLRDLIKALPSIKANCSAEVVTRHLQLIAYFQSQYDELVADTRMPAAG